MRILHTFFPRGYNLEGKSSNRRSPRVRKATAMLWRKGSKPSLVRPNNKVWVHVNVLPIVASPNLVSTSVDGMNGFRNCMFT
jgi:hypothetical protein